MTQAWKFQIKCTVALSSLKTTLLDMIFDVTCALYLRWLKMFPNKETISHCLLKILGVFILSMCWKIFRVLQFFHFCWKTILFRSTSLPKDKILLLLSYIKCHYLYQKFKIIMFRHMNATKSYMHFGHFAWDGILCSNFFCFFIVFNFHILSFFFF